MTFLRQTILLISVSFVSSMLALASPVRHASGPKSEPTTRAALELGFLPPSVPPLDANQPALRIAPNECHGLKTTSGEVISGDGLSPDELKEVIPPINFAAGRYPPRLIREQVPAVHVVKNLRLNGQLSASAITDSLDIVLSFVDHDRADDDAFAHRIQFQFHYTLMKRLLFRFPLLDAAAKCKQVLPEGVFYDQSNIKYVSSELVSTEDSIANGFVSPFARASPGIDLSQVAANQFTFPGLLNAWCDHSINLARKRAVLREILERIEPAMDAEFYKRLQ